MTLLAYYLSLIIAAVAELWRPVGRHRTGRRELSTFEAQAEGWGRTMMLDWPTPPTQPVTVPVAPPRPGTIGARALGKRGAGAVTEQFQRIGITTKPTYIFPDGTVSTSLGNPARLERKAAA